MTTIPYLSIIVPVYNVELYLEQCIKSILKQNYQDFELILIDDGSTDASGKICDYYKSRDNRIIVLHTVNQGVSSARNKGLQIARGKWCSFIDSDDYISEDFFINLFEPLNADDEIDFVHGGYTNCNADGIIISIEQQYESIINSNKSFLLDNSRGLLPSKLFRKSIIDKRQLKFYENVKIAEDQIFTIEYLTDIKKYAFVRERGYIYRRHSMSATKSLKRNYIEALSSYRHLSNAVDLYIRNYKIQRPIYRDRQLAKSLFETILLLYRNGTLKQYRLEHIKRDFSTEEIKQLKYIGGRRMILSYLLSEGFYGIFDIIVSIIFKVKQ